MNTLYMTFLHIYYCFLKTPRSGVLIDIHFKNLQQYGVLKYILLILLGKNSILLKIYISVITRKTKSFPLYSSNIYVLFCELPFCLLRF